MSTRKAGVPSVDPAAQEPLLTYPRSPGEERVSAVVTALSADPVNVNPAEREPLHDWVDFDAITHLFESARGDVQVSAVIWDYHVVITSDAVEVYEPNTATD